MRSSGSVRNFEAVLDELGRRGHRVHLAFELAREQAEVADRLAARHPTITHGRAPARKDRWGPLAHRLRSLLDALRYLEPLYDEAPKLRRRGLARAPRWLTVLGRGAAGRRELRALIARCERALPADERLERFVAEHDPDAVLVTPLVDGPTQSDYIQAAHAQ